MTPRAQGSLRPFYFCRESSGENSSTLGARSDRHEKTDPLALTQCPHPLHTRGYQLRNRIYGSHTARQYFCVAPGETTLVTLRTLVASVLVDCETQSVRLMED
jgi:hypothetical protein